MAVRGPATKPIGAVRAENAQFLYHIVPSDMAGNILFPLHRLAVEHPRLAEEAAEKYSGRRRLMDVVIPLLGCRWNDVIHLTPLHPSKTRRALAAAGFAADDRSFFAVPPQVLKEGRAVCFANSKDTAGAYDFDAADFVPFVPDAYRELESVPTAQARYFSEMKGRGERPLLWARTPHVFYSGSIDIRGLKTVSW